MIYKMVKFKIPKQYFGPWSNQSKHLINEYKMINKYYRIYFNQCMWLMLYYYYLKWIKSEAIWFFIVELIRFFWTYFFLDSTFKLVDYRDAKFTKEATYMLSTRGNHLRLVEKDYAYTKYHSSVYLTCWRCPFHYKYKCKAKGFTKTINKKEMVQFTGTHNHPAIAAKIKPNPKK